MIVDAHHHLWRPERGYAWLDDPAVAPIRRAFLPPQLCAELARAGVDRTVLVEAGRCREDEAAEFLAYAAETEQIAGVVAWADIASPSLATTVAGYRRLPGGAALVGIRSQVQGEPDPDYLDRGDVRRGLTVIADADLAFDLVVRVDQLPAAARAAAAVPGVRLVLDHLGKPRIDAGLVGLRQWRDGFRALADNANVTCKLSGMVTEAGPHWTVEALRAFVELAVDVFGPARLMFGSDWPVCLLAADYVGVRDALGQALPALSAAQREDIFGGTAVRAYGLTTVGASRFTPEHPGSEIAAG